MINYYFYNEHVAIAKEQKKLKEDAAEAAEELAMEVAKAENAKLSNLNKSNAEAASSIGALKTPAKAGNRNREEKVEAQGGADELGHKKHQDLANAKYNQAWGPISLKIGLKAARSPVKPKNNNNSRTKSRTGISMTMTMADGSTVGGSPDGKDKSKDGSKTWWNRTDQQPSHMMYAMEKDDRYKEFNNKHGERSVDYD